MQISLETTERKRINLEVDDSSDTINLKIQGPTRELILCFGPDWVPEAVMQIFVLGGKSHILEVKGTETTENVMVKIHEKGGPPVNQQRLLFQSTQLDKGRTMADYRIKMGSILDMLISNPK